MLAREGKLDENIAGQLRRIKPLERSEKTVSDGNPGAAEQPGEGHSLVAPRGLCFGSGRSGHYKW